MRFIELAGGATILALAAGARGQAMDAAFLQETRTHMERLEKLGFAGVLVLAERGEPRLVQGYGLADRERGVPWTPATVSTVGSITKQFTGAAILLLEEEGRLSVADPITRYFDDVPPDKRSVTLHHLLTHSSGIGDLEGLGDWDPIDREGFVRRAMEQPLRFAPGAGYEYSNAGYSLLGAIIEQLTAAPYEVFMRERLFQPAGMFETGYIQPQWGGGRLAQGYVGDEAWGTVLGRPMAEDGPYWVLRANGGIHSTALDMLRWAQALLGGRVLSPESMARYWAPHVDEGGGSFYAYGWVTMTLPNGARVVTHNGGNGVFFADMALVPDAGVVVFLQTNVLATQPGVQLLLERIGARLFAGQPYPALPDAAPRRAEELRALAGAYRLDGGDGVIRVAHEGDGLLLEAEGPVAFGLLHSARGPDLPHLTACSQRLDQALRAALAGDLKPLHEAYGGRVPLERLRQAWSERVAQMEAEHGALERHEILGSASEEERDLSVVRFQCARGAVERAYVWGPDGTIRGVSVRGLPTRLRILPDAGGGFASWDGGIAPSRHFEIHVGSDGSASLRWRAGEREVEARRGPA
jgi:CubicO group peptidase (beta-lactamase class C family)